MRYFCGMHEDQELPQYKEIIVDPRQSSIRIDKFIFERIEKISRSRVQKAIDEGKVLVNGKNVKSNYKVRPLDKIELAMHQVMKPDYEIVPEEVDFEVVYEDDHVMVVNKPAGLVVHPGIGNASGTLVNGLSHYLKKDDLPVKEGNETERMGLVHRIDKNTSGLLLIAKTEDAMTNLSKQFFDHTVDREYIALVWGELDPEKGEIEGYLARHPQNRKKRKLFDDPDAGKWSKTHYETIETFYYVSLVKCKLETGRTHQIRVHMSDMGHPLFADDLYGGDSIRKGTVFTKYKQFVDNCFKIMDRHALHAKTIGFTHPETGERMSFDSDLPEDFNQLIDKWRRYVSTRKSVDGDDK